MISNKLFSIWTIGNDTCTLIIKKELAKLYGFDNCDIKLELNDEGILIKREKIQ
jgi:hypothetical protein